MAASGTAFSQTFGEKPKKFQLEEGGDYYYIGSEVRYNYMYTVLKVWL